MLHPGMETWMARHVSPHCSVEKLRVKTRKLCPFYNSNFNASVACHAANSGHLGKDYSPKRGGVEWGEGEEWRR